MKARHLITALLFLCLTGCRTNSTSEIPYFSEDDLTPLWEDVRTVSKESHRQISDFSFTDQNGEQISAASVAGRPYVTSFFFASCTNICPTLKTRLTAVSEAYDQDQITILSHSVTPDLDTVERLAAYSEINNIDDRQWKLLTGTKSDILNVAVNSYGAQLQNYSSGLPGEEEFLHTETVYLVDGDGYIRGLYNGTLQLDIRQLISDLEVLLEEA